MPMTTKKTSIENDRFCCMFGITFNRTDVNETKKSWRLRNQHVPDSWTDTVVAVKEPPKASLVAAPWANKAQSPMLNGWYILPPLAKRIESHQPATDAWYDLFAEDPDLHRNRLIFATVICQRKSDRTSTRFMLLVKRSRVQTSALPVDFSCLQWASDAG
jgi:hypothetical protein